MHLLSRAFYHVLFVCVLLLFVYFLKAELRAKGWELRKQEGDGNCLFRAISQQIYGDPGMHGDIRRQCLDFMRKVGGCTLNVVFIQESLLP